MQKAARRSRRSASPSLSIIAMMRMDPPNRRRAVASSVPVRKLEAQAERVFREAGGFWGLVGAQS